METSDPLTPLALDYRSQVVGNSLVVQADCFEWLERIPEARCVGREVRL